MSNKLNFKAQLAAFRTNAPEYVEDSYFFYDWFCQEKALKIKSKLLMTKAEKVMSKLGLDSETHRVFLKNNCPVDGKLYDSFTVMSIETDQPVAWVAPSLGYTKQAGKAQLVDFREKDEEGKPKEILANSWKELTHSI